MKVTIDAFSGRPNPSFETKPGLEEVIMNRLKEVEPTDRPEILKEGLGLRSYLIQCPAVPGFSESVEAQLTFEDGYVSSRFAGEFAGVYKDTTGLEDALKAAAVVAGFGEVVGA